MLSLVIIPHDFNYVIWEAGNRLFLFEHHYENKPRPAFNHSTSCCRWMLPRRSIRSPYCSLFTELGKLQNCSDAAKLIHARSEKRYVPHRCWPAAKIESKLHVAHVEAQRDVVPVLVVATVQQQSVLQKGFDDNLFQGCRGVCLLFDVARWLNGCGVGGGPELFRSGCFRFWTGIVMYRGHLWIVLGSVWIRWRNYGFGRVYWIGSWKEKMRKNSIIRNEELDVV